MPEMFIIAGPNGAGKTTAAKTILPEILHINEFVNADEIAKGLSPFNQEGVAFEAGRIMLNRIDHLIKERKSFAFETTLATRSYLGLIREANSKGYFVHLIFLWLAQVELAKQRVNKRVSEGGHNIPKEVIERRYDRGLKNLPLFMNSVADWYLYDNSEGNYVLIAKRIENEQIITNLEVWKKIVP